MIKSHSEGWESEFAPGPQQHSDTQRPKARQVHISQAIKGLDFSKMLELTTKA